MDLQTPEPEFGCRTPDSQTPEPRNLSSGFRTSTHPYHKCAPCPDSGPCILYSAMAALNAIVCEALLAEAFQHLPTSARSASATPHVVEAAAVRELQAAHAALGTVREEAATVGRQLLLLRSAAELLYPPGTPKRSNKVLVELRTHGVAMPSEFELDLLLSRLHAHDDWNRALRSMTCSAGTRAYAARKVSSGAATKAFGWLEVGSRFPRSYAQGRQPGCCAHTRSHSFLVRHIRNDVSCVDRSALSHTSGCQTMSPLRVLFETDSEVPESGAEKKIMAAGESGVRSPEYRHSGE